VRNNSISVENANFVLKLKIPTCFFDEREN